MGLNAWFLGFLGWVGLAFKCLGFKVKVFKVWLRFSSFHFKLSR